MILERLYLENYKQFREPTELLPPEGAVGVVGRNGSGKTTIFEAILWAFFGSRGRDPRFSNDSIPWSGGSTAERTLVEVTLNIGGAAYKVTRALQRGKTEAKVFISGTNEPLVSGSSEVGEWVQKNLLDMDRTAFEATFFARQKELEFFAGVTGVERQREIARILGIDQVEEAQKLLRADRKELKDQVFALENLLEGIDHEELKGNLEEAREELGRLKSEDERLGARLAEAEKELSAARAEGKRLEEDYRRHNELSGELAAAESEQVRAAERAGELREVLAGLDADEKTVEELKARAEALPGVVEEIAALEEARWRHERVRTAQRELGRHRMEAHRVVMEASNLIEELDGAAEDLPSWDGLFLVEDEAARMREATKLLSLADGALGEAEGELAKLKEVRERLEELGRKQGELEEAQAGYAASSEELVWLDARIGELTGGGKLEEWLGQLRREERSLERQAAQQRGLADADDWDAEKLEVAARMIETSEEVAECPTCHRGFEGDEHLKVIASLRRQAGEARARAKEARDECRRLDEEARELREELAEVEEVQQQVQALREERTTAVARHETLEKALVLTRESVEYLREGLDGATFPTDSTLEEAHERSERLRALRDARPRLEGLCELHENACAAARELEGEISDLREKDAYDEGRHEALQKEKAELERLLGRIETLEARLRGRGEVEERLTAAVGEGREAARRAGALREELKELAFDETAYFANRQRVASAETSREELRGEKEKLSGQLRQVEGRIEGLEKELSRYEEQRKAADEKSAEASRLGEMDKLLSEFYRELTARVRPTLQDEASKLVKTLTDGRYERVEFDQNYGVRLFDGLSDAYEISRFSGGEADVVSLSARVALSKMVAAKGAQALGFLVLDEVFGALDAERRRNVLLALDRLKKTFGQIFIISHVGDVQESALLDELWMVEEDEEGKSTVRRVKTDLGEPVEILEGAHGS